MTLLKLSPNALAHCRFAISPLAETVGVMITLQRRCTDPAVARWHAEHQPAYRRWLGANPIAAALLPLIASTKRFPDMIALPPEHGMNTRLSDELATMTTFSDEQIRAGVRAAAAASWKTHRLDWLDTPNLAARTAELFQQGWQQFVEPDWPRRRGVLERDIMYRAGLLAAYGWRHTVETMKQRSVWVGDNAIRFSNLHWPDRLIDDGLILFPARQPAVGGRVNNRRVTPSSIPPTVPTPRRPPAPTAAPTPCPPCSGRAAPASHANFKSPPPAPNWHTFSASPWAP